VLFNSYEFILIFLPFTFFLFFFLNHKKHTELGKVLLVLSSLFFYSWWNIVYLPLIISSIIFNYFIGSLLSKPPNKINFSKKTILLIGISINLSLLGYFQYFDFFIDNFNLVSGTNIEPLNILLPLAISFFTFQQIAFLVDSYRQQAEEIKFLNYSLFVTFFPQLIAGPIVHHKEMMPQFAKLDNKRINYKNISLGIFIFSIGLFKKVIIADTFAIWATAGFDSTINLKFFEAWITSLSYTFQLYFDFSGYADMAIGAALLFNIKLPVNFNSPYKSLNITDFWRRWHITLSRFLRDYIYIPLGGNRKGNYRTYNNLLITFLLGGLWHGAGWTFIVWGFLHGIALIVQKFWSNIGFKLWRWASWLITFNFINIAWIFFRAKDIDQAVNIIKGLIGLNGVALPYVLLSHLSFLEKYGVFFNQDMLRMGVNLETFVWIFLGFFIVLFSRNSIELKDGLRLELNSAILSGFLFIYSLLSINHVSEFIYFNF